MAARRASPKAGKGPPSGSGGCEGCGCVLAGGILILAILFPSFRESPVASPLARQWKRLLHSDLPSLPLTSIFTAALPYVAGFLLLATAGLATTLVAMLFKGRREEIERWRIAATVVGTLLSAFAIGLAACRP